jgi:hypothetical protein
MPFTIFNQKVQLFGILMILLLLCLPNISCQKVASPVSRTTEEKTVQDIPNEEGVQLDNPGYSEEMFFKASLIEGLILFAVNDGRSLLGCDTLKGYDTLINEGSLPIIFANRYTGEDMISTADYSPGDIFLDYNETDSTFRFFIHNGDRDAAYEPGAVADGTKLPWAGDPGMYMTDGRSLFWEENLDPNYFTVDDPSGFRERFLIPATDTARTKVFIVYYTLNKIMSQAGNFMTNSVPDSIDGYIAMAGRKNPVAWVNPYDGGEMVEVPWVKVSTYSETGPSGEEPWGLEGISSADVDVSNLPGNYSFITAPSPTESGENWAYAQFYFLEPDGSVSAYVAVGLGPTDSYEASTGWTEALESAGYSTGE